MRCVRRSATSCRSGEAKELRIAASALRSSGWAIGAFSTLDGGRPIAVSSPSNSFGGGANERPDATGVSAALPGGPKICDDCQYFNTAAFVQTPACQCGNVSRCLPDVNHPTSYRIDAQFETNTRIRERLSLSFRAELFNGWNTVIFSGPTTSIASSTFGKIVLSQSKARGRSNSASAFDFK